MANLFEPSRFDPGVRLRLVLFLGTLIGAPAMAQTDTFDVTANVVAPQATCSTSIEDSDFGTLDAAAAIQAYFYVNPFSLDLNCTVAVPGAFVTFDGGGFPTSTLTKRMLGPLGQAGDPIHYFLEDDTGPIPHNGSRSLSLQAGPNSFTVLAVLEAQTLPSDPGVYVDTVTATFTF